MSNTTIKDLSQINAGKAMLHWIATNSVKGENYSVMIQAPEDGRFYALEIANRRSVLFIRKVKIIKWCEEV